MTNVVLKSSLVFIGIVLLTGCSSIEPWVKPYEREWLADPMMSFGEGPLADQYRQHVFEVREASRGGGGGVGGGCGCN